MPSGPRAPRAQSHVPRDGFWPWSTAGRCALHMGSPRRALLRSRWRPHRSALANTDSWPVRWPRARRRPHRRPRAPPRLRRGWHPPPRSIVLATATRRQYRLRSAHWRLRPATGRARGRSGAARPQAARGRAPGLQGRGRTRTLWRVLRVRPGCDRPAAEAGGRPRVVRVRQARRRAPPRAEAPSQGGASARSPRRQCTAHTSARFRARRSSGQAARRMTWRRGARGRDRGGPQSPAPRRAVHPARGRSRRRQKPWLSSRLLPSRPCGSRDAAADPRRAQDAAPYGVSRRDPTTGQGIRPAPRRLHHPPPARTRAARGAARAARGAW